MRAKSLAEANLTSPARKPVKASFQLLGQRHDDALGAANITEPILVLVLLQAANEFAAVGAQAGDDIVNIFDGEHDVTCAATGGKSELVVPKVSPLPRLTTSAEPVRGFTPPPNIRYEPGTYLTD